MNAKQIEALVKAVIKAEKAKKAKVKQTPKQALIGFMKKHGYSVKAEKPSSYTNKAGETKKGIEITFTNGRTYMVGESRFWKL